MNRCHLCYRTGQETNTYRTTSNVLEVGDDAVRLCVSCESKFSLDVLLDAVRLRREMARLTDRRLKPKRVDSRKFRGKREYEIDGMPVYLEGGTPGQGKRT